MSDKKQPVPDRAVSGEDERESTDLSSAELDSEGTRTEGSTDDGRFFRGLTGEAGDGAHPDAYWQTQMKRLIENGLKDIIAQQAIRLIEKGTLSDEEFTPAVIQALNEASLGTSIDVLRTLDETSFAREDDKSAFLLRLLSNTGDRASTAVTTPNNTDRNAEDGSSRRRAGGSSNDTYGMVVVPPERVVSDMSITRTNGRGPDPNRMQKIFAKTLFTLAVSVGQRKYTVIDTKPPPTEGNEVFLCKIPRDVFEDELIPLLQSCGEIYQLRFMLDPLTGFTRGYAFCKFKTQCAADKAVRKLDDFEMRPGRKLGASVSFNNQRLFVSNIPKNKDKDELHEEFSKHSPGLVEVIIYSSPDDRKKNRGFCFLEYENHKSASMAKRKLGSNRVRIWNCDIIVDWADPLEQPDDETMAKVKVLYVRNLTQKVLEEDLKKVFQAYGVVERIKKIKDYAFVHFTERDNALKALVELNGAEICGAAMEVTLAKPPSDKRKKEEILRKREMRMTHLMYNRGKFWNSGVYGNNGCGRAIRAPPRNLSVARSGINAQYDFSIQHGMAPPMSGGYLGYAAATAAAAAAAAAVGAAPGGPPEMFGMPPMAAPGSRQHQQMAYAHLLNAADYWDDFNDLDMSCSPLAPAAVPIPASAAASIAPPGHQSPHHMGPPGHQSPLHMAPPGHQSPHIQQQQQYIQQQQMQLHHQQQQMQQQHMQQQQGGPQQPPVPYGNYSQYLQELEYANVGAAAAAMAATAVATGGPPMRAPMPGMAIPGSVRPQMAPPFPHAGFAMRPQGGSPAHMGQMSPGGAMQMAPQPPRPPFFNPMDANRGGGGDGGNGQGNCNSPAMGSNPNMYTPNNSGNNGRGNGSPHVQGSPGQSPYYYQ